MAFITTAVGAAALGGALSLAGGATKIGMSLAGRKGRIEEQEAARAEMEKYKDQYKRLDTSNIYAGISNPYANMENVMEDLTVNQQQAQFERQMAQQSQANIMQNLRGAAGGSGIAGLAQAMASQGQLQAQRASASIGMQESQIGMQRAQEAGRLQTLERRGAQYAEQMRLQGAETARGLEWSKTGTLLGMSQQRTAAANQARAQARAQQMSAVGDIAGAGLQFAAGAMGMKRKPGDVESVDDVAVPSTAIPGTFGGGLDLKTSPNLGYQRGQLGGGTGLGFGGIQTTLPKFNQLTGKFE